MLLNFLIDTPHPRQEPICFSLQAINRDEAKENVFEVDHNLLARSAVIYGPNGSGKTHLLRSLQFFLNFVSDQGVVIEDDLLLRQSSIHLGIIFYKDGEWFEYSFEISKTGILSERFIRLIHEDDEVLSHLIFTRQDNRLTFHHLPSELKKYSPQSRELFLPVLAQQGFGDAVKAFNYLRTNFMIVLDLDNPDYQQQVIESNLYHCELRKLLRAMRIGDTSSLAKLSRGTRKAVALATLVVKAIMEGEVLVVDDLDTYLHPLVTRHFVRLFHSDNNNPKNAQLIFAASDTSLIDENLFQGDQIYFVEQESIHETMELTSILEYRIKKDLNWQKCYLDGRIGATPRLCYFDPMWT